MQKCAMQWGKVKRINLSSNQRMVMHSLFPIDNGAIKFCIGCRHAPFPNIIYELRYHVCTGS